MRSIKATEQAGVLQSAADAAWGKVWHLWGTKPSRSGKEEHPAGRTQRSFRRGTPACPTQQKDSGCWEQSLTSHKEFKTQIHWTTALEINALIKTLLRWETFDRKVWGFPCLCRLFMKTVLTEFGAAHHNDAGIGQDLWCVMRLTHPESQSLFAVDVFTDLPQTEVWWFHKTITKQIEFNLKNA